MSSRPRTVQIQMLTGHQALGGGARDGRILARGLRRLGVRVSLLCTGTCAAGPLTQRQPQSGFGRVATAELRSGRCVKGGGDADYDEIIACRPRCWPLLWRFQPLGSLPFWHGTVRRTTARVDAVIALSSALAVATHWARPRLPLLYAPAVLDRVERPHVQRCPSKWFEQKAFQCADRVLLRTPAVREAIETLYCPLRQPTGICLPGIDDNHASGAGRTRADLGIPSNAKLLVTVGVLNENKGQRHIARALAQCAEADWWWAIVGEGDDAPAIHKQLRGSSIESRTLFVGVDRHVGDWCRAADLFVGASRSETFGYGIAEALAVGLPVVIPENTLGATLSPLAEVVERYRLGCTYRRGDQASLAGALHAALGNERERDAMGRRAAAFARANFDLSNYAECALRLFDSSSDVVYETVAPDVSGLELPTHATGSHSVASFG